MIPGFGTLPGNDSSKGAGFPFARNPAEKHGFGQGNTFLLN